MEEQKFNKRITFTVIAVLLIVLVTIGATLAYFSAQAETGTQTVTTATIGLEFDDNSAMVLASGIIPVKTNQVLTDTKNVAHKNFKIKKVADADDMYATIELKELNIPEGLAKYDFKWMLMQGENKIATGDFGGKTSGNIVIATNQLINTTEGINYDLYIWINETGLSQNEMQGQTFSAKVVATGSVDKLNTLANTLLENNENITTTSPTFTTTSTDRGLFVQQGDVTKSEMGFPTYYFRGSATNDTINSNYVMNNYIKFGTYAESGSYTYLDADDNPVTVSYTAGSPILWRIVRINEDGSIKITTDDITSSAIPFNSDSTSKYIRDDGTNSEAKTQVENWYNLHIASNPELDNKVVMSNFCHDIFKNNITFICPASAVNVYSKVGLLTASEILYAGAVDSNKNEVNNTTYLASNDRYFWTITPTDTVRTYLMMQQIALEESYSYKANHTAARVVINLSPDVIVSGGDGLSAETAYTIQ